MPSTSGAWIWVLPNEVLLRIFSLLPVADLGRCAATCDRWHRLVTGFTHLWRNKAYISNKSPRECAETHAVLHALPTFREVIVNLGDSFVVEISYPRMVLSVKNVGIVKDSVRLRCEYLATSLDFAGHILAFRSTVDFEGLLHLCIVQIRTRKSWVPCAYSADYVVRTALSLCPGLRHLSICARFLSAERLDAVNGFGRLKTLHVASPGLERLSFLRHCSATLEELQLVGCTGLPSRELAQLGRLRGLRSLRLGDCRFAERDLAAAVAGLAGLETLHLDRCSLVRDLSVLQRCRLLRTVCIANSPVPDPVVTVQPGGWQLRLHHRRLPPSLESRPAHAVSIAVTAEDLPSALSTLRERGLATSCVAYLAALRPCSRLQHWCCEFAQGLDRPELLTVRVDVTLNGSAQS